MFCSRCAGTGEIVGNGMMLIDCVDCFGSGDKTAPRVEEPVKIDRKSKAYKDAIKEIMDLNPDLSREDAIKMFEETYDKV